MSPSNSVFIALSEVLMNYDVRVVVQGGRTVPLAQTRAGGVLVTRSASMINTIIYQVMSVMSLSW